MKYAILFLLTLIGCSAICQTTIYKPVKKKGFVWPKPIKDSIYFTSQCDTLYGVVEYKVGAGVVKGEGIVVSCRQYECSKSIYSKRGQEILDSLYKVGGGWYPISYCSGGPYPSKNAFVKTKDGYKYVDGEFLFTPL